ncbi:MAG TPA: hypothetical protein VFB16_14085 [Bauldia sp.]|nr:hypothetical protein [Bauldia sp.]
MGGTVGLADPFATATAAAAAILVLWIALYLLGDRLEEMVKLIGAELRELAHVLVGAKPTPRAINALGMIVVAGVVIALSLIGVPVAPPTSEGVMITMGARIVLLFLLILAVLLCVRWTRAQR